MVSPDGTAGPAPQPDLQVRAEREKRAASFGAAAPAYARHRPDYALAAIRWVLGPVAAPGRPVRIADLGAGTGKLTAQLAALEIHGSGPEVVAIEPDPEMLAELRAHLPGVTALAGRAEDIPLPDRSVDAVLAGQSAHWFDLERAMPEIARVLAPGGVFGGLWNADDDRVDWVAGLHQASGRRNVVALSSYLASEDDDPFTGWISARGRNVFSAVEEALFEHAHARTADSLVETMRTHSMFLIMEPAEREAVLGGVREYLAATPQTASGEFLLPLCTLAIRLVRR